MQPNMAREGEGFALNRCGALCSIEFLWCILVIWLLWALRWWFVETYHSPANKHANIIISKTHVLRVDVELTVGLVQRG